MSAEWPVTKWQTFADATSGLAQAGCEPAIFASESTKRRLSPAEAAQAMLDDPSTTVVVGNMCPNAQDAHNLYTAPYFVGEPDVRPGESLFATAANSSVERGTGGHIDQDCSCSWSLQLAGEKFWELQSPLAHGPRYTTLLQPGDMLFWCGGWWHRTEVLGSAESLALRVTVPRVTAQDGALPLLDVLQAAPSKLLHRAEDIVSLAKKCRPGDTHTITTTSTTTAPAAKKPDASVDVVDVDAFYSEPSLSEAKQLLGATMHFHHGEFAEDVAHVRGCAPSEEVHHCNLHHHYSSQHPARQPPPNTHLHHNHRTWTPRLIRLYAACTSTCPRAVPSSMWAAGGAAP